MALRSSHRDHGAEDTGASLVRAATSTSTATIAACDQHRSLSMSSLPLSAFPFAPTIRAKLAAAGFVLARDLLLPVPVKPTDLARELAITNAEALDIIKTLRQSNTVGAVSDENGRANSALSLYQRATNSPQSVFTLCQKLDGLLGEGVALKQVTEFCGVPGIGKTQLCLQLAVDASIPTVLGGTGGDCVYIDTEGSFMPQRAYDVAQGLVSHLSKVKNKKRMDFPILTAREILGKIHVFRIFDSVEQSNLIAYLPSFLDANSQVRLIVIDSIAFHLRRGFDQDYSQRARILAHHAHALATMAVERNLAVVLINQVTTRINGNSDRASDNSSGNPLAPALGESWAHACTNRVLLHWHGNQRMALLLKSPSKRVAQCEFTVNQSGIRDVKSGGPLETRNSSTKRKADGIEANGIGEKRVR